MFWMGFNSTVILLSLAFIVGTYMMYNPHGGGDLKEMMEKCIEENKNNTKKFEAEHGTDGTKYNEE